MKTLTISILSIFLAIACSSCCYTQKCADCPTEHKLYDTKGRLIKHTLNNGNYETFYYDGKGPDDCTGCVKTTVTKQTAASQKKKGWTWPWAKKNNVTTATGWYPRTTM